MSDNSGSFSVTFPSSLQPAAPPNLVVSSDLINVEYAPSSRLLIKMLNHAGPNSHYYSTSLQYDAFLFKLYLSEFPFALYIPRAEDVL